MARRRNVFRGSVAVVAAVAIVGCASAHPRPSSPEAFRQTLKARSPDLPDDVIVVPFEVRPQDVAAARDAVKLHVSDRDKALALAQTLRDPKGFGLRYDWARNGTAVETIDSRHGNCLSLSSVYVGLARSLGLEAEYVEATYRPERFPDGEMIVSAGHVGVAVKTHSGPVLIGFGGTLDRPLERVRPIEDVEALAHLYNNRGYELVRDGTRRAGWDAARDYFRLATRVHPGFAGAWNNLGIAETRLGNEGEAERAYREAIARGPTLPSPRQNLGALYLDDGRAEAALAEFAVAAQLDPQSPFIHYLRARALAKTGALAQAKAAVERSIELDASFAPARELLADIAGRLAAARARTLASTR